MADRWLTTEKWIRPIASIEQITLGKQMCGVTIGFRDGASVDLFGQMELDAMLRYHNINPSATTIGIASSLCLEMLIHLFAGGKRIIRASELFDRLIASAASDIVNLATEIDQTKDKTYSPSLNGKLQYILLKHNPVESSVKKSKNAKNLP